MEEDGIYFFLVVLFIVFLLSLMWTVAIDKSKDDWEKDKDEIDFP